MTYALDTNIIVDCVNAEAVVLNQFQNAVENKLPVVIPATVDYEVLRGFYHIGSTRKQNHYGTMRRKCPVVEVNSKIWDCAASLWAKLRKTGRDIGDADTIIAAHCIISGYTLVTHNTKHFEGIDGLQITDWNS